MRMTAIRTQTERKQQVRSVRHAEKRRYRAGTLRFHGPIRQTSGVCPLADTAQGEQRLSSGQNQVNLLPSGRLLLEFQMKIAVLTSRLDQFAGSEIVATEVANYFARTGHHVAVQADRVTKQIKETFDKSIFVTTEQLNISDYDFVWSQHGQYLKNIKNSKALLEWQGILASVHLSYHHPTEIYHHPLSLKISGARVFNSAITRDSLERPESSETFILFNAAPERFHKKPSERVSTLKNILVVSNHLPVEISNALQILKKKGINARIIGRKYERKLIEPSDFDDVDAVITIGKTTQYSLVSGTPVYCYDHFGGPGWLDDETFAKAEYFNFNGSCTGEKRSGEEIASQIIEGFEHANLSTRKNWDFFHSRYHLETFLEGMTHNAAPNKITKETDLYQIEAARTFFARNDKLENRVKKFRKATIALVLLHILLPFAYIAF